MAVVLKHKKVVNKPDGTDESVVRPSDWNEEHSIQLTGPALLGKHDLGNGDAEEIFIGDGLTIEGGELIIDPDKNYLEKQQADQYYPAKIIHEELQNEVATFKASTNQQFSSLNQELPNTVRSTLLQGFLLQGPDAILETDSFIIALGKLQAQLNYFLPIEKLTSFANSVLAGFSTSLVVIGDSKSTSDAGQSAYPKRLADYVVTLTANFVNKPAVHYYEFDYTTAVPRKLKPRQILQTGDPIAQTFRTGVVNKNIPRIALFPTSKTRLAISFSIKPVAAVPVARATICRAVGAAADTFAWNLYIEENTGDLVFIWSTDGKLATYVTNRVTKAQLGNAIESGVQKDLAVEFIGDNGTGGYSVKFYSSPVFADTWTEIAAASVSTSDGTKSIYALDTLVDSVKIGGEATNFRIFEGEIYDLKVSTHLQGGIQSPPIYEWMPLGNLLNDGNLLGTATINIFAGGYPGIKTLTMLNNEAMFPRIGRGLVLISTADNEDTYEATLYSQLEQLRAKVEAVYPYTPKAVVLINYNIPPFANKLSQRYRVDFIHNWAVENNLEIINCTDAFARLPNSGAAYIKADGQHPIQNNPGSDGQAIVLREITKKIGLVK